MSGKITIDAGWKSYRAMVIPKSAGSTQVEECHRAFYAGAAILFHGIMKMLDPGDDPTEADLESMSAIQKELEDFGRGLDAELFTKNSRANG